jgi:ABC-type spermidine/putrescine transport system permease subunit II
MRSRDRRAYAVVAALLVLPLLALTLASFAPHEGHGCHFDKDCLSCRWAADSAAEAAAPVALVAPVVPVGFAAAPTSRPYAEAAAEAASSRGPPPSA